MQRFIDATLCSRSSCPNVLRTLYKQHDLRLARIHTTGFPLTRVITPPHTCRTLLRGQPEQSRPNSPSQIRPLASRVYFVCAVALCLIPSAPNSRSQRSEWKPGHTPATLPAVPPLRESLDSLVMCHSHVNTEFRGLARTGL